MKCLLSLVVLCALAGPALAGDGNVPGATLSAYGLGALQQVSDADGMQVRGMLVVDVKGTSLIFGQLLTPDTKNFVVGSSVNEVDASGSSGGDPLAIKAHEVSLGLFMNVGGYTGVIGTLSVGPPAVFTPSSAGGSGFAFVGP